jgi:hypothetical protein
MNDVEPVDCRALQRAIETVQFCAPTCAAAAISYRNIDALKHLQGFFDMRVRLELTLALQLQRHRVCL